MYIYRDWCIELVNPIATVYLVYYSRLLSCLIRRTKNLRPKPHQEARRTRTWMAVAASAEYQEWFCSSLQSALSPALMDLPQRASKVHSWTKRSCFRCLRSRCFYTPPSHSFVLVVVLKLQYCLIVYYASSDPVGCSPLNSPCPHCCREHPSNSGLESGSYPPVES